MSKALKGILFDFNGTLFFDSQYHMEAFQEYFVAHGKEKPSAETVINHIFGKSNKSIYMDFFCENPSNDELVRFIDEKEGIYQRMCLANPSQMKLAKGAAQMLEYLKENGIPYCLATGSGIENIEFYMQYMNLGRYFDMSNIVYFDGSFEGKPHPDTYRLAAKKLGLDAAECIVFEDGTSGMLSAARAGAGAICCVYDSWLPSPFTDETRADLCMHDFTEWRDVLAKFGILR